MPEPFGHQLLIDCYHCEGKALENIDACHALLLDVVDVLGVHMQSPPFVFRTDGVQFPDKAGLSGWVPLVESGIQIHTLIPQRFVSLDVYSCHAIDETAVLARVKHWLDYIDVDSQVILRGTKYHAQEALSCPPS